MELKAFFLVFTTVFIAELGDKTQIATLLFATDKDTGKVLIFLAASAALVVASAIGVLAGSFMSEYINERYLQLVAGFGFIAIGSYTIFGSWQ